MTSSQATSETNRLSPEANIATLNCTTHGDYQAREYIAFKGANAVYTRCPGCDDARKAEETKHRAAFEAQRRADAVARAVSNSNIPLRFAFCTFQNYKVSCAGQTKAVKLIQQTARAIRESRNGASLVLTGKPGCGKNHLASALANELTAEAIPVLFATVISAIRFIKSDLAPEFRIPYPRS